MNTEYKTIIMRDTVYINTNDINKKVGVGFLNKPYEIAGYHTDFRDALIHLQLNPQFNHTNQFMNIPYSDINYIEYSLCSRTNLLAPLSLPYIYPLIDIIIYLNDVNIHVEVSSHADVIALFNFLEDKKVKILDPFGLTTLTRDKDQFKSQFDLFCKEHFEVLAKQYHLDNPRK